LSCCTTGRQHVAVRSIRRRLHCPDHDLIKVDLRGHGATRLNESPASFTFTQLALDVVMLWLRRFVLGSGPNLVMPASTAQGITDAGAVQGPGTR
jgi:pimeloyl-ACP methyl ester carboxylesterase